RCGNSSKCWNTMPTFERSFGRLVLGSCSGMPLTVISPFWNGSSALTVLISVDLPEPDGPHTTTTSPLSMLTEQSLSTCTDPYHLDTFRISIILSATWQLLPSVGDAGRARSSDDGDLLVHALDDVR